MESKLSKGGIPVKNRLEELRKARGITQEELAALLEVSRQTRYFGQSIEDIFLYEEDAQ